MFNGSSFLCANVGAVSVENFTGAVNGQRITLLGDGQTTFVHDATKIYLTGTVNLLLAATAVIELIRLDGVWRQSNGAARTALRAAIQRFGE